MNAIDEGWHAYHNEVLITENPYPKRSLVLENSENLPDYNDHDAWELGWLEAEAEELIWEFNHDDAV